MGKIFDSDDNSGEEELTFTTNAKFAKSYDKKCQKELLKKLKDQDSDSADSSSSGEESEEDDGFADEDFDKTFFSTLASIKARDPKIYKKDVKFFGEIDLANRKRSRDDKPITIRDLERKVLLENDGMFEENKNSKSHTPVMTLEEKEDKQMFEKFLSDSDDEDILFKSKKASAPDEKSSEINPEVIRPITKFWNDPEISKEEAYLRDYILKRRFRDDAEEDEDANLTDDEEDLEKQAEFEQRVNFRFEEPDQVHLKRFPRTITTSVRNVDDKRKRKREEVKERKAREKEERRRELEKLKELKKQEIEEKIAKLKQVSGSENLPFDDADLSDDFNPEEYDRKMKEIFNDEYYGIDEGEDKPECPDIEDLKVNDWDNYDPEEAEQSDPHCDDPDFNMDCEYDATTSRTNFEKEMMEKSQSKKRKKRRSQFAEILRKEKPVFNPADEKTYSDYIDEYYKMDCEDVIGDVKCRFKYTETVPNDFGLSVEEILLAKNKELNKWASLKKAVQIRPKHVELNEVQQYERKRNNMFLKRNILKSVYGEDSEEEDSEDKKPEKASKESKLKIRTSEGSEVKKTTDQEVIKTTKNASKETKPKTKTSEGFDDSEDSENSEVAERKESKPYSEVPQVPQSSKKKKKKPNKSPAVPHQSDSKRKRKPEDNQNLRKKFKPSSEFSMKKKSNSEVIDYKTPQGDFAINESRLMAFGINPKKFRGKVKYGTKQSLEGNNPPQPKTKKKKNRKKKSKTIN
ncbi:Protein KRI1 homolog [Sergentomyia squamirostris]